VWDWIQLGVFSTLQHTVVNDGVLIVQGEQGEVFVSSDPQDASIIAGFKLNMMNMRDATAGTVRPLLGSEPFDSSSAIKLEGGSGLIGRLGHSCRSCGSHHLSGQASFSRRSLKHMYHG